nr:hypothetical protein [Tanacetum cinerariifolium]
KLYQKEQKWIDDFKPMDDDSQQQVESNKKRQREVSDEESFKKQKLEADNDAKKEELRAILHIVPRDDIAINTQRRNEHEVESDFDFTTAEDISTANVPVTTAAAEIGTASLEDKTAKTFDDSDDITLAETLIEIRRSVTKPQKVKGVAFRDVEEIPRLNRSTTTLQPLPSIDLKDKGKAVLVEEEHVKVKRRDQGLAQIESDAELAQRLYKEELTEKLYQKEQKWIDDFKPMDDDSQQQVESNKKRQREVSDEESFKKQKLEADNDAKKEELRAILHIVPRDDIAINVESLATKYPTYKPVSTARRKLVLLWGDLKILFEPNEEDEIIMDTTKAQQIALDDALVAPANRLKIGKCNHRLNFDLKSNEPTIQVVLDALKLTPFYNAFQITPNVPEIYIDMLHICPRLPGQRFKDPPLKEEILSLEILATLEK